MINTQHVIKYQENQEKKICQRMIKLSEALAMIIIEIVSSIVLKHHILIIADQSDNIIIHSKTNNKLLNILICLILNKNRSRYSINLIANQIYL